MPPDHRLDADRLLALTYAPVRRREPIEALWRLDGTLGNVLAGGRDPMLSRIKLVWWRDSLEKLDHVAPPGEPVLEAVSRLLIPRGITGGELARMEEAWSELLGSEPLTADELSRYSLRGALLFRFAGRILDVPVSEQMEQAGQGWALVDLARNSNPVDAEAALTAARERLEAVSTLRWPSRLRSIGMLAVLAGRDAERGLDRLEPHGAPGRMLRMFRHRISGR